MKTFAYFSLNFPPTLFYVLCYRQSNLVFYVSITSHLLRFSSALKSTRVPSRSGYYFLWLTSCLSLLAGAAPDKSNTLSSWKLLGFLLVLCLGNYTSLYLGHFFFTYLTPIFLVSLPTVCPLESEKYS